MRTISKALHEDEKGIALVTTLMLSLLLSVLVAGILVASTSDTLIGGNDVRNNQAFYIAETGINRAAGWFTAKFEPTPSSGMFVLPEKFLGSDWMGSNSTGAVGKLSYTTGEANYQGQAEAAPYYKPGASATSTEQTVPTSVKILLNGSLQNVVLAGNGDSANTYPASYTVNGLNAAGVATTYTYTNVVGDFTNNLVNQQEGDGAFTVKATLISILPPTGTEAGMVTWLLKSEGKLTRGTNTTIASATVWAYMSALVTKVEGSRQVSAESIVVNADPGVVARGMVTLGSNTVTIDSYKSSKGLYGASIGANSFTGQIGSYNKGSRGDVRTNNELLNGVYGYLNITNGVVTGNAYSTFFEDGRNGKIDSLGDWVPDGAPLLPPPPGPINIDTTKVMYTQNPAVFFGSASVPEYSGHKEYGQRKLEFPDIAAIPSPTGNTYNYSTNATSTLPSGNWNNINISKGKLTVPGGTYGTLNLSSQGQVVLGTPGQTTTYNFQGFVTGSQTQIVYAGPVVINVKSSLDIGGQASLSDLSTPASAIHWNFKGGNGEVVQIHGGGDTVGVFYAPNNELKLYGNGDFYGALAAKLVDLNGSTRIHVDEDAVLPVTTTKKVVVNAVITVGYTGSNYSLWRVTQAID
jgi:Tfp pilus assembly protein PilX